MPNTSSSFTSTEIKAGIFVILGVAVVVAMIAAILKYRPEGDGKIYFVYSRDTLGLDRSADVRFGGLISGTVVDVSPDPEDQSRIRATIQVFSSTPVNAGSTAFVSQTTLTSEKHLEITTGTKDAPLLEPGSEIPSSEGGLFGDLAGLVETLKTMLKDVTVLLGVSDGQGNPVFVGQDGQTIAELFSTMEGLLEDFRVLVGVVDAQGNALEVEGRRTFSELLVSLDSTVVEGGEVLVRIDELLEENAQEINDVLTTAKDVGDSAKKVVDNLDSILTDNRDNIDGTIQGARDAIDSLDQLMAEIRTLTISLQGVIDDNSATLEDTLNDLSETMRNLKEVTRTLAEQPQSIIRGKESVGRR